MSDIRLTALDLGTNTGVTYGCPGRSPNFATWRMPPGAGDSMGQYANIFSRCLANHIETFKPTLIVFEAPFLSAKLASNMNTARRLLWAPGECERQAYFHNIECNEANLMTVRKTVVGKGNAEKFEVQANCRERGLNPQNNHEADACAVWLFAVICLAPGYGEAYNPLFKARA